MAKFHQKMRFAHVARCMSILVIIFALEFVAVSGSIDEDNKGSVSVDKSVFMSSVPVHMTLGQMYVAKVMLTNLLNIPVTALVRIDVPFQFFVVEPYMIQVLLSASESRILEFEITPHKEHIGPLRISAMVSVTVQGQVVEEETLNTEVRQISRPIYYQLILISISIAIGASVIVYYSIRSKFRKR